MVESLTSTGRPTAFSSALENPVNFFPSKMDLPFESLASTRALEWFHVSLFRGAAEKHKVLTRVHDRRQ